MSVVVGFRGLNPTYGEGRSHYLEMGSTIGKSDSSKVMFMDPRSIPATLQGMLSIVDNGKEG